MKKIFCFRPLLLLIMFVAGAVLTGCGDKDTEAYVLGKTDIQIVKPEGGFVATVDVPFKIEVRSVSDNGVTYKWMLNKSLISDSRNLQYTFTSIGEFTLVLTASQGDISFDYPVDVTVGHDYVLKKEDIRIDEPAGGFTAKVNKLFTVEVTSASDHGLSYRWYLDDEPISESKELTHIFESGGAFGLKLVASQDDISFEYEFTVFVSYDPIEPPAPGSNPYITQVLDYMPAVGQFTNKLPLYEEGDTQQDMNRKVLESIGNNARGMITLGGFGGYVVVGFDHTIENIEGRRDFRVLGNAFYANSNPSSGAPDGGSCEPGIIMVAYDANGNGTPDENEWFEIAGSAHTDPTGEPWYEMARANGNDVNTHFDYRMTYHKPEREPEKPNETQYIRWEDNRGNSGYKFKHQFHTQPYYPLWADNTLSFTGTCLPQNGIDESGTGSYFVLYKFRWGYADNEINNLDDSAIDIGWAVDKNGNRVNLPGVDWIKIYTGVNQENGWLGETSTEIMGVEDLHLLGERIDSPF